MLDMYRSLHHVTKLASEHWPTKSQVPEPLPVIEPEQEAAYHMRVGLHPDNIKTVEEQLFQHVWGISTNRTGAAYYTSDHPVTTHSLDATRRIDPGIGTYGVEVSLPLSPHYLLSIVERKWISHYLPQLLNRDGCMWRSHSIDNVTFYRSLQVRDSYRFVYAPVDDFALAREMCTTHPELREPERPQWTTKWAGRTVYGPADGD
jgi:hypothetical protein